MSIGKWKTFFQVKVFNIKEFIFCLKFYKNMRFCLIDLMLFLIYLFMNPYRVSKKFLIKNNSKEIHAYGETPITTLKQIAQNCLESNDILIELGSGRGRAAFWLCFFKKCRVIAIEWIFVFSFVAKIIAKIFRVKNISFVNADMFKTSFEKASAIYLYGTMLQDAEIRELIEKFKKEKKLKIITISYSLNEYDKSYKIIKTLTVRFPWGETTCYLNQLEK